MAKKTKEKAEKKAQKKAGSTKGAKLKASTMTFLLDLATDKDLRRKYDKDPAGVLADYNVGTKATAALLNASPKGALLRVEAVEQNNLLVVLEQNNITTAGASIKAKDLVIVEQNNVAGATRGKKKAVVAAIEQNNIRTAKKRGVK